MKKIYLLVICIGILGAGFVRGATYTTPSPSLDSSPIISPISLIDFPGVKFPTEKEIMEKIQKRIEPKNDFDINHLTEQELKELTEKIEQKKLLNAINSCEGYYLNEICYLTGESFNMVGESYFVEGKHFYLKKEINESCNQSYECKTNLCYNQKCILNEPIIENSTNEENKTSLITGAVVGNRNKNFLERILIKFLNWFK